MQCIYTIDRKIQKNDWLPVVMFFDQLKTTTDFEETNSLFFDSRNRKLSVHWFCCHPIIWGLAFAVTSDGNIDELGDGDDGNLGVQDDAKIIVMICSLEIMLKIFGFQGLQKYTYSEAMLISGASKQISCAIF